MKSQLSKSSKYNGFRNFSRTKTKRSCFIKACFILQRSVQDRLLESFVNIHKKSKKSKNLVSQLVFDSALNNMQNSTTTQKEKAVFFYFMIIRFNAKLQHFFDKLRLNSRSQKKRDIQLMWFRAKTIAARRLGRLYGYHKDFKLKEGGFQRWKRESRLKLFLAGNDNIFQKENSKIKKSQDDFFRESENQSPLGLEAGLGLGSGEEILLSQSELAGLIKSNMEKVMNQDYADLKKKAEESNFQEFSVGLKASLNNFFYGIYKKGAEQNFKRRIDKKKLVFDTNVFEVARKIGEKNNGDEMVISSLKDLIKGKF